MTHLTYLQAAVTGLIQGVSEMFPISSLGHSILIPALMGGSWARDLNVAAPQSPYLTFIVSLHVATAFALIVYFWRDWVRLAGALLTSIRYREIHTADEKVAWMLVVATIPAGLAGLAFDHVFQAVFGHPRYAAAFLILNGIILVSAERFRRRASLTADAVTERHRQHAELTVAGRRYSSAPQAAREREDAVNSLADWRLATLPFSGAILIGSAQVLALLAGISRDGVTMAAGLARGLSREDAARLAFLLATPVILAAGALKLPELAGPLGNGIRGQVLVGSVLSGAGAYMSVRYLVRYLQNRTLTPFGVYCLVAGLASLAYLTVVK